MKIEIQKFMSAEVQKQLGKFEKQLAKVDSMTADADKAQADVVKALTGADALKVADQAKAAKWDALRLEEGLLHEWRDSLRDLVAGEYQAEFERVVALRDAEMTKAKKALQAAGYSVRPGDGALTGKPMVVRKLDDDIRTLKEAIWRLPGGDIVGARLEVIHEGLRAIAARL